MRWWAAVGAGQLAAGCCSRGPHAAPPPPCPSAYLGAAPPLVKIHATLHCCKRCRPCQRRVLGCGRQARGQPGRGAVYRLGDAVGAAVAQHFIRQSHPHVGVQRRHRPHILLRRHADRPRVHRRCGRAGPSWALAAAARVRVWGSGRRGRSPLADTPAAAAAAAAAPPHPTALPSPDTPSLVACRVAPAYS